MKRLIFIALASLSVLSASAQTGTAKEPVAYTGGEICNPRLHDGGFRYAVGAENIQVLRANRTHPDEAEGYGWTYNHAPNITYWRGTFYLEYLSNPVDEQQPPGHTLMVTSKDGRHWSRPQVVFPEYKAPDGVQIPKPYYGYIQHQRMGFYTAPNGRLLILAFQGHSYNPFKEGGIGRMAREVHSDGSLGPIYFIRYSSHANWNETNTSYPFYTKSKDKGFRQAVESLLKDKLKTLQWIDEDRGLDGFYALKDSINTVQATSYYHRKDGQVVALWKWSWAALSADEGQTWSTPVRCPSLIMAGGKQWGQQTADGRYAIAYNPIETQPYRYPLTVITGDDGICFSEIGVVHGEVPPRRFMGENKDFGPCYVRGITEGEARPDASNMWLTYSVNKEDIWVTRVPLPIKFGWQGPVSDDFSGVEANGVIPNWNIYRPRWCQVWMNDAHELCLSDSDRYDYARAIRVFEEAKRANVSLDLRVEKENSDPLEIDLTDRHGTRAVSLSLINGEIRSCGEVIGRYEIGKTKHVEFTFDNGRLIFEGKQLPTLHAVESVERLSLRTGEYRDLPNRQTPNQDPAPPLEGCDERIAPSLYVVDNVKIS